MEMITLVLYDVEDDRARTRVSDACRDYGLQRIQYSCFRGRLSRNRREDLRERLQEIQRDWERRWRRDFPDSPARMGDDPYPPQEEAREAWRPVFKIIIQPICDRDLGQALYAYLHVDAPESLELPPVPRQRKGENDERGAAAARE